MPVAQVLLGVVALLQAQKDLDQHQHISQARRSLLAANSSCHRDAAVVASACLAELESLGGHAKKADRIDRHVQQVLLPPPSALLCIDANMLMLSLCTEPT